MRPPVAAMLLVAAGFGFTASPVVGQPADGVVPPAQTNPAPLDRFGLIDGEQLLISAGTDDKNLTFRAGLPTGPSQSNRFSLTASRPLHDDEQSMPASLDALANGTRITLGWGRFGVSTPRMDARARQIRNTAVDICHHTPNETQCEPDYAVQTYDGDHYNEYLAHIIPGGATDIGLDATMGINDFDWVDPVTFASHKDRHTDWSVAGHIDHYVAGPMLALTGSVSYQRAYEAATEQRLCPPNAANPATDCVTARGAAPHLNENFLLSAGLRYRFTRAGRPLPLAIAPQVTYDVIDNVFGVDVPLYFVPSHDGKLTGGVRFGYRSDRDGHFSIGMFFGAAFSILQ